MKIPYHLGHTKLLKVRCVYQMDFVEWMFNLAQISLWITALVFIIVYILKPIVMFIPLPILYMTAGFIFGKWIALAITFGGIALALISGYYTGKFLGEERVNHYLAKNISVKRFLEDRNKEVLSFCFLYRILPLPFDVFNIVCGAISIPFLKYLIVSLLGLSVWIIPNILAGAYITNPLSPRFFLPFGVSLVITSSVFILYQRRI